MTPHIRNLAHLARDLKAFFPFQLVRALFDRDYQARMDQAAFAHDAVEGLNEFEAENDGLDGYREKVAHAVREATLGPEHEHAEALERNTKEVCEMCSSPVICRMSADSPCPLVGLGVDEYLAMGTELNEYADPVGGAIPPQHHT